MIPGTGYQVRYERDGMLLGVRPVVAFRDDGDALVIGNRGEGIVRARSIEDFARIEVAHPPVVAAVPGGGWRVQRRAEGAQPATEHVVAWLVRADGRVEAVTCDATGRRRAVRDATSAVVMLPPGEPLPG